jgi:hypothetical protein
MRSNSKWLVTSALAALLYCAPAAAQTLYKLIDKNGKVTYSESAPKNFDGQVIRIDIDPNANTMTLPKPKVEKPDATSGEPRREGRPKRADGKADKATLDPEAARERLENAKSALAEARDSPKEGEITWIGKVGGGTRPVFSEDYQKRIEKLEQAVKNAEEELRLAEGR